MEKIRLATAARVEGGFRNQISVRYFDDIFLIQDTTDIRTSFIYKLAENSNLEVARKFNFFGILCLSMSYVLP